MFGDQIERLARFDPLTGEVDERLNRFTIYPKSHYVTPRETLLAATKVIRDELAERLSVLRGQERLLEAQRLEQRTQYDLEMIEEEQRQRIAEIRDGMQQVGTHPEARLWAQLPTLTPPPTSLQSVYAIASILGQSTSENATPET